MKIPYKKILHVVVLILCILVLAAAGFVTWIAAAPRSMPALSPYIEAALSPPGSPYKATVGETVLSWAGWERPVDVQLKNVRILTQSGTSVATFPNTSLGLDMLSLLLGEVVPRSITIRSPRVHLFKQEDGDIVLGFEGSGSESVIPLRDTAALFASEGDSGRFRLRHFRIEQADISIDTGQGTLLRAPNAVFSLERHRRMLNGFLRMELQDQENHIPVQGEFTMNMENYEVTSRLQFEQMTPTLLGSLFTGIPHINALEVPISGTIEVSGIVKDQVPDIAFDVRGEKGQINDPEQFSEPLAINGFEAKGTIVEKGATLRLENFSGTLGNTKVALMGIFKYPAEGVSAKGKAELHGLHLNDLAKYWPQSIAPGAKGWVTANIRDGLVKKATAEFDVTPEALEQMPRPESLLNATLDIENAHVTYLDGHPSVSGVHGIVYLTGNTIKVDADAGKMLTGSTLKKGIILMPNLSEDNPQMIMDYDVVGPAADIVSYLDIPDLNFAKPLGLSAKRITGDVEGAIHLDFPLRDSSDPGETLSAEHIKFDIKAVLKNVSQTKVLDDLDITGMNGDISVTNPTFTLKGKASVHGIPTDLDVEHDFTGQKAFDTRYNFTAGIPTPKQKAFGYPDLPEVSGRMLMKADVEEKGNVQSFDVAIDLTNTELNFSKFGWVKANGKPSTLNVKGSGSEGAPMKIKQLALKADDMKATGSAVVAVDRQSLQTLALDTLVSGDNNLALTYENKNGLTRIDAKGESADLSGYFGEGHADYSREQIPAIDLTAEFKRVILNKEEKREIKDLKARLDCSALLCGTASATGTVNGSEFTYKLGKAEGARSLQLETKDAGALVGALGITSTLTGGTLTVKGTFDDEKEGRPLTGSIEMRDYVLHDAPVLTKLLTLGSFTGFLDTLGGKGIAFKKLSAPFVMTHDTVKLKDAKTYGPALGITADGTINLKGVVLDIDGTLVPSYTLNTVLGKIPVIGVLGEAIMGGEGKGLIAANYSIKGEYPDPKVSLNPLSILTPGFLRGLFDIFDAPKKTDE